jgi:phage terminase large subunit-like protein
MAMKTVDKKALERFRLLKDKINSATDINPFEDVKSKEARKVKAMKDVSFMVQYYFPHYATCESADFQIDLANKVKRNKTIKVFVEWPRGHAKSVWVNVFIPFWLWMNGQCKYLVVIGNSHDKAKQLLGDLQAELESNKRIINDFGEQKLIGSWEEGDFQTKGGFIAKALGMGQSVRGLRVGAHRPDTISGDDLEIEELVNNPKRQDKVANWIERALLPCMDGEIRRFLYANNKYAPRMVQTVLQEKHPNWKVHHVKAYDPVTYEPTWKSKYDAQYWKDMEDELGTLVCKAEYNQKPHKEGKIFKDEYFIWDKIPKLNHFDATVAYWDVAYSGNNDYNAIRIWGKKDNDFYMIKCFVRQCKMYDAIYWMFLWQLSLPKTVDIPIYYESQFWNEALEMVYNEVKAHFFGMDIPLIKDDDRKGNKYQRILTMLPYYQQGRMIYNQKIKATNDAQEGCEQLKGIEPGYSCHDDAPDADHGAITKLNEFNFETDIDSYSIGESRRNSERY